MQQSKCAGMVRNLIKRELHARDVARDVARKIALEKPTDSEKQTNGDEATVGYCPKPYKPIMAVATSPGHFWGHGSHEAPAG